MAGGMMGGAAQGQLEIEQKFHLDVETPVIEGRLRQLGATPGPVLEQRDRYFNHPSRDFATTDEALRIRSVGNRNWLTWKGPKYPGDVKSRPEIETPLGDGSDTADQHAEILTALGFRPVATIQKRRHVWTVESAGWTFELALDEVQDLGKFLEIEILTDSARMQAAQAAVRQMAADLGLTRLERSSYLGMLLKSRTRPEPDQP